MSYHIVYDIDYSGLNDFIKQVEMRMQDGASNLKEAVQTMGIFAQQEIINTASTKFKHSKGDYARGVMEGGHYPFQGDPFHYNVIHPSKIAKILEDGYEPFDMKKMLWTSDKVRMNKKGKRYLVIPFRHGTPNSRTMNAMPEEVYSQAKQLRHSVISGTFREGSIKRATTVQDANLLRANNPKKVRRNIYNWGDRLESDDPKYHGMVRFQHNVNVVRQLNMGKFAGTNKTSNTQNYSSYITFRVMSEESEKWQHPGLKPMGIFKETKERIEQPVIQTLRDATIQDFNLLFGNN